MFVEHKERPVNEPGSLLESLQCGCEYAVIDELLQTVEIVEGSVPVLHEDLRCQLAPHTVQVIGIRGLDQNTVKVQVLASPEIVTTLILALTRCWISM